MNTPSGGLEGIVDNEEFYSLLNVPRNVSFIIKLFLENRNYSEAFTNIRCLYFSAM